MKMNPLQTQLERLTLAVDVTRTGIFDLDLTTGQLDWCKHHELIFGYAEGTFSCTPEGFCDRLHPDDRERVLKTIAESRQSGNPYEFEARVIWPDKSEHWVYARGNHCYDSKSAPIRIVGTVVDITERKRLENELHEACARADAANQAKSEFLARMSHEIRTPLSAVIGLAELLMGIDSSLEEAKSLAKKIHSNGRHLLELIDDILDLSRIEARQLRIRHTSIDLSDLINDVINMLLERAQAKSLKINIHIAKDVPQKIFSDPVRIRQILINIIGNAIKFTNIGSVNLNISKNGKFIAVEVEDTGIGIDLNAHTSIFHEFVQANASIYRSFGGSGVGLSLSRELARALGGDLHLKWSVPDVGSCFNILIDPQVEQIAPKQNKVFKNCTSELNESPIKGKKILIVEDAPDILHLIRHYLRSAGVFVETAINGAEACKKAQDNHYDAILMDIQMPEMDGYEATRRLRMRGFDKPILALTAHAMKDQSYRSVEAGFDDHINKPISGSNLVERLSQAMINNLNHSSEPQRGLPQINCTGALAKSTPIGAQGLSDCQMQIRERRSPCNNMASTRDAAGYSTSK